MVALTLLTLGNGSGPVNATAPVGTFTTSLGGTAKVDWTNTAFGDFWVDDVSMVSPANASHGDTFDGGLRVGVCATSSCTYTSTFSSYSGSGTANASQMLYQGADQSLNGLTVATSYKFSSTTASARILVKLQNASGSSITRTVRMDSDLGCDSGCYLRYQSTTGATIGNYHTPSSSATQTQAFWTITTDQGSALDSTSGGDPIVSLAYGTSGTGITPTTTITNSAATNLYTTIDATVPANSTRYLMFVLGLGGVSTTTNTLSGAYSGANTYLRNFTDLPADLRSDLTDAQKGQILNWLIAPQVSSFAPTSTLTTSTSLTYNLQFSETVTGLAVGDFSKSGTGSASCTIGSPTGSGNSYQISLTGCSEGTVILTLAQNAVTSVATSQTGPSSATNATTAEIDRTAPTISSVDTPSATTYGPGTNINFTVRFSESVTVTGTPRLPLTVGATQRYANFVSLSDSKTATFRYTVQTDANDIDTDGVTLTSPAETNSATINDLAGNSITNLSFTSPTLTSVKVAQRAAAPTITAITGSSGSLSVAFTAGSDNGSSITNYEYSTNGGTSFTAFSPVDTTTPLVISGLSNGTTYQVKIRALTTLNGSSTAGESSTSVSGTPTAVPAASVSPSISGTVSVGSRLTASTGTWTNSPTSYTYRWVRSQTLNGTYTAITNATSDSYTIVSGDNSYFIKVAVTATNASGSKTETSSATTQVKVPISISGGSNITTTVGVVESSSAFTASGGYGAIGLSVSPVHPQVTISNGIVVAGSSLPAGSYTETVTATDSLGDTATTTLSISVLTVISAPSFTVARGASRGSIKLTFTPVTGASSYTVKVYKSVNSFVTPYVTVTNYTSGTDIQDGDPDTCSNSSTPICYGIRLGHTFRFTITPVADSGYTSTGESAQSGKYGIFEPTLPSVSIPTTGVVGLDVQNYQSINTGFSSLIAYAYASASSYVTVFDSMSIVGLSTNRFALPSGENYKISFKYFGTTIGDVTWLDSDESTKSSARFVLIKPNPPSNILAVRNGSQTIRLTWNAAAGPYQQYYYYTSTDGTNFNYAGWTSTDSATITGLTNGTPYYIRIFNWGSGNYGRHSDYILMTGTITPATTPGQVASLGATASNSTIDLTWTAPSDTGGALITSYLIEYSASVASYGESTTALSSATSASLTGLVNGTSYFVRITARNEVGSSPAVDFGGGSSILVKGTAGSTAGAVTSITRTSATISATVNARGNTTTPTLTWGIAGGSQTNVTLSSVSSDSVLVTSNLTGLLPGRRYQVTSSVTPGISQDVGGTPIYFTTTPDSPTGVTSTSTNSKITVAWDYNSGASGYWFTYSAYAYLSGVQVGSGCPLVNYFFSAGRTSCEFTGLAGNTTYSIHITSTIYGGDYGNGSSEAYVLTAATDPNTATISLVVNSGNLTIVRGNTVNIVANTNVAGAVTFKANGRIISGCKQKATSSLQATCAWRPSTHGVVKVTALFNPTSNQYTNVTSSETSVMMTRRSSR